MAKKTAIVSVRIVGNSTSAIQSLNKTADAAKKFKKVSATALGAVAGVAGSIFGKITNSVLSLGSQMIECSDSAQKFAKTLKFAGLSDKKIKQLTDSTQEYANKTVYHLDDIRNTTAQLAANGVKSYDKLAEAAGNLTSVAGGGVDQFKSVALVLTQTAGAGKLTTENWNQLANAIPGASGMLIKAMRDNKAFTGDFREAMAKGKITAEEFNQAILQLGMSDAAKKAAGDTSQLSNAADNLSSSIASLGAKLLDIVKPQLTEFLSKFTDIVNQIAQSLPQITSDIANWVKEHQDGIKTVAAIVIAVTSFIGVIKMLYGVMMAGSIIKWVRTFSLAQSAMTLYSTAVTIARDAQAAFNLVMEANPIVVIITAILAVVAALAYFFTQTETGRKMFSDFAKTLQNAWQSVATFFTNLWNTIVAVFNSAFSSIGGAIASFISAAVTFFNPMLIIPRFIIQHWDSIVSFFRSLPSKIGGFFAGLANIISSPFRSAFNAIRSLWNSTIGGFGFTVPDWIPMIGGKQFKIPMLANGGYLNASGTVLVGERGPELLTLPKGAQVTPLSKAKYNVGGAQGNTYNITIQGTVLDRDGTAREIRRLLEEYDRKRA